MKVVIAWMNVHDLKVSVSCFVQLWEDTTGAKFDGGIL